MPAEKIPVSQSNRSILFIPNGDALYRYIKKYKSLKIPNGDACGLANTMF
jgi:hypothetical protein